MDDVDPISILPDMRDSIDNIDATIIHIVAARRRITDVTRYPIPEILP